MSELGKSARARLQAGQCGENMGCGVMKHCMCAMADDFCGDIEAQEAEIGRLREAMSELLHALKQEGEHDSAGGSLGCTVCGAIGKAEAALSPVLIEDGK